MKRKFRVSLLLCVLLFFCSLSSGKVVGSKNLPIHVYLTWSKEDLCTTMTINYQTVQPSALSMVYYGMQRGDGKIEKYTWKAQGSSHEIPVAKRTVHWVELEGLKADTTYYFIAGNEQEGFSSELKFRTPPVKGIRFVSGGDMEVGKKSEQMMVQAARQNPHFVMIGGDIAYVNGLLGKFDKWDQWLWKWEKYMKTSDGSLIPMILAIGNHEVLGGYGMTKDEAPFYFGYFSQGGRSYFHRMAGEDVLLVILDSGHVASHKGPQTEWLKKTLEAKKNIPARFAIYHVPLYPSHRPYAGNLSKEGRSQWAPIFEEYGMSAVFENHDHSFKRTKPILKDKVDPQGVVYLGDGCWGVSPRKVYPQWYLEKTSSKNHIWVVNMTSKEAIFQAVDLKGKAIDSFQKSFSKEKEKEKK